MGGGGGAKGLENFFSREDAKKWREETYRVMARKLEARGDQTSRLFPMGSVD